MLMTLQRVISEVDNSIFSNAFTGKSTVLHISTCVLIPYRINIL